MSERRPDALSEHEAGRSRLAELYLRADAEPSIDVDAAILRSARDATRSRAREQVGLEIDPERPVEPTRPHPVSVTPKRRRSLKRWSTAISVAAVVLLCAALVPLLQTQLTNDERPNASVAPAANTSAAPELAAPTSSSTGAGDEANPATQASGILERSNPVQREPKPTPAQPSAQPAQRSAISDQLSPPRTQPIATPSQSEAAAAQSGAVETEGSPTADTPPPEASEKQARRASKLPSNKLGSKASETAKPPAPIAQDKAKRQPPQRQRMQQHSTQELTQPQSPSPTRKLDREPANRERQTAQPAAPPVSAATSTDSRLQANEHETRLERVRALLEQGHREQARKALRQLMEEFPTVELDESLRTLHRGE